MGAFGIGLVWGQVAVGSRARGWRSDAAGLHFAVYTGLLCALVVLLTTVRDVAVFLASVGGFLVLTRASERSWTWGASDPMPPLETMTMSLASMALLTALALSGQVGQPPGGSAATPAVAPAASVVQLIGAGCFGAIVGWFVYYINRYRKSDVQLSDLISLIGIIGGGAVIALFPASTDAFGAYGIGLAVGFFGYFLLLVILIRVSQNFDGDWFLDGRRKTLPEGYEIPGEITPPARPPMFADPRSHGIIIQPGSTVTIQNLGPTSQDRLDEGA